MNAPLTPMSEGEKAFESLTEDLELVIELEERYEAARTHSSDWREEAADNYDFVAGHQWASDDLELLEEYNRPSITFNYTGPTVDTIAGLEIANRQETMYYPRDPGDAMPNEILTATAKWVRDECDAGDEESEAFVDMAITGVGWTETWIDFDYDPEGKLRITRQDPLTIYVDPSSTMKNYSDAHYLIRVKDVPRSWLKATWPKKELEISVGNLWTASGDDGLTVDRQPTPSDSYKSKSGGTKPKSQDDMVRLLEYQYCKYETFVTVKDPYTGNMQEFDPERFLQLFERFASIGIQLQFLRQARKRYYRAFVCGDIVLEKGPCPCPFGFTYKAMTGKRDRNNGSWYGVVRAMKDPQRWANKWLSQGLHIINSNAQGGVMIEEGAVDDPRAFEESWTDPSAITWVPDGALQNQRIQPKPSVTYPSSMEALTKFAVEAIPKVTGLNVELLGMADREQPADLEHQRRQAGVTILNALFNSQARYRKEHGRLLLYMMNTYISDGRMARINIKGVEQFIPLVKHPDTAKYDVVVSEAPTSTNVKERTWVILKELLPVIQSLGLPMIPEFLDYVPLPQPLLLKLKEAIAKGEQSRQASSQMEQQQAMALLRQQLAAAAQDEAGAETERAKSRKAAAEANIEASPLSVLQKILEMYNLKATADKTVSETPFVPPFDFNGLLPLAQSIGNFNPRGPYPQFQSPVSGGQYAQAPNFPPGQGSGGFNQGPPAQATRPQPQPGPQGPFQQGGFPSPFQRR